MRDSLRQRQTQLLRALVCGGPPPEGFDPIRVRLAAQSLANKRRREVSHCWPGLGALDDFGSLFNEYARTNLRPPEANPVVDGYRFAVWMGARTKAPAWAVAWICFHWCEGPEGLQVRLRPGLRFHPQGGLWIRLGKLRQRLTAPTPSRKYPHRG